MVESSNGTEPRPALGFAARVKGGLRRRVLDVMRKAGWQRVGETAALAQANDGLQRALSTKVEHAARAILKNRTYRAALESARETLRLMKTELGQHRAEKARLEASLAAAELIIDESKAALAESEEARRQADALERLRREVADLVAQMEERASAFARLDVVPDIAGALLEVAERHNGFLEGQRMEINDLRKKVSALVSSLEHRMPSKERIDQTAERTAAIVASLEALSAQRIEIDDLRKKVSALVSSLEHRMPSKERIDQTAERTATIAASLEALRERSANADASIMELTNAGRRELSKLSSQFETEVTASGRRERQLSNALVAREVRGARDVATLRAAAERFRSERNRDSNQLEEAALFAELQRLDALAKRHTRAPWQYSPDLLLSAIREGRAGICSVRRRSLLEPGSFEGRSVLIADDDLVGSGAAEWLGDTPHSYSTVSVGEDAVGGEPNDTYDVVLSFAMLELARDPIALIQRLDRMVAPGGRLVLLGGLDRIEKRMFASAWRAPPLAVVNALPQWRADRVILAGPGASLGIELYDPELFVSVRPAAGRGGSLIAPPYMHVVADMRKPQVDSERIAAE